MKKTKLLKLITIPAAAGLMLLAMTSCGNNTVKVDSIIPLSNTESIQTYASTYTYTLADAIDYDMSIKTLTFDKDLLVGDPGDFMEEILYDIDFENTYQVQNRDFVVEAVIPFYSKTLGKYFACIEITIDCDDRSQINGYGPVNIYLLENVDEYDFTKYDDVLRYVTSDEMTYKGIRLNISGGNIDSADWINGSDAQANTITFEESVKLTDMIADKCTVIETDGGTGMYNPINYNGSFDYVLDTNMVLCTGEYKDTDSPILNIPAIEVDVDAPISFNEIKSHITATDPTEGEIGFEILDNEYQLDEFGKIAIGEYTYTVKATDSAGNSITRQGVVIVKDKKAPTITANDTRVLYNKKLTEEEIKALFEYSDNYYEDEELILTVDMNIYNASWNKKGTYDIPATIKDPSGNTNTATLHVEVYDDIKPTLVIPKDFTISNKSSLTLDDIKANIKANDGCDGAIEYEIVDNESLFPNKAVGVYTFTITAKDSSNNTTIKTLTITVEDMDAPIIDFDMEYFFYIPKSQILTQNDIVQLLIDNGRVEGTVENNNLKLLKTEYLLSPAEEGEYELYVELTDGRTFNDTIIVTSNESDVDRNWFEQYIYDFGSFDRWGLAQWLTIGIGALIVLGGVAVAFNKKRR